MAKKLFALLLAVLMVLSMAACNKAPAPTDPTKGNDPAPTDPAPETQGPPVEITYLVPFEDASTNWTNIEKKLNDIAKKIYHADGVALTAGARKQMTELNALGFGELPICMAKTQYSFSDNPKALGAPKGFTLNIRQARLNAGAGFIVAFAGDIIAMPGLPKVPAAEGIDVTEDGVITGLF